MTIDAVVAMTGVAGTAILRAIPRRHGAAPRAGRVLDIAHDRRGKMTTIAAEATIATAMGTAASPLMTTVATARGLPAKMTGIEAARAAIVATIATAMRTAASPLTMTVATARALPAIMTGIEAARAAMAATTEIATTMAASPPGTIGAKGRARCGRMTMTAAAEATRGAAGTAIRAATLKRPGRAGNTGKVAALLPSHAMTMITVGVAARAMAAGLEIRRDTPRLPAAAGRSVARINRRVDFGTQPPLENPSGKEPSHNYRG